MEYTTNDLILPALDLPTPTPVRIEITDSDVLLYIGPRDWQWDKGTGKIIGASVSLESPICESGPSDIHTENGSQIQ